MKKKNYKLHFLIPSNKGLSPLQRQLSIQRGDNLKNAKIG
jgi:hypothetical protein